MCFLLSALAPHVAAAVDTAAPRLWNISRHMWDGVFEKTSAALVSNHFDAVLMETQFQSKGCHDSI